MRREWEVWNFRKTPPMTGEVQPRRYIFPEVKCPSLFTDRKKKKSHWWACALNDGCGVSENSLQWQARYSREGTFLAKICAFYYWHFATKHIPLVKQAPWIMCVEFQKNLSNGRRDTPEKVYCSQVKRPSLLNDCNQSFTHCRPCP
jgi:hypothetical protein